jgi:hypothetical protein
MTGGPLGPVLPNVAAGQAAGEIGAEHVRVIRRFFADVPAAVDFETRRECEVTLARIAGEQTADALRTSTMTCAARPNATHDALKAGCERLHP